MLENFYKRVTLLLSILLISTGVPSLAAVDTTIHGVNDLEGEVEIEKGEILSKALAHYAMGVLFDNQNRVADAIEEYKKALKLDPDAIVIHVRLGSDYLLIGKTEEAINEFAKIESIDPDNAEINYLTLD